MSEGAIRSQNLKSLELQGYKTFASRTVFEFGQKITAIVGPNGSGKSNIADAIRWVLGEQSYALLRGKKTEDMIFAGSDTRPRASMASASITFDNSDGWLPIDFSEVSIGRRAYRDGQNEYLINGHKVRLREVAELLAEVGLAQRTYTVIGQGLVDAALSLKAEERRRLFEEAAGIGLYRNRREESLRRLEATRHNLERVQDILAELRPRLRSLDRQAERARNYEQVKNDLEAALRVWYGHHWHRMVQRLAEDKAAADSLSKHRDDLRRALEAAESSLLDRRVQIDSLRKELHDLSQETSSQVARREALGTRLAVAQERQRWLAQRCLEIEQALTASEEERSALQGRQEALRPEAGARQHALAAEEAAWRALTEAGGDEAAQRLALESRLQDARRRVETALSAEASAVARRDQLTSQLAAVHTRLADLQTEVMEKEAALAAAQGEMRSAQEGTDEAEEAAGTAQQAVRRTEQALASAQAERDRREYAFSERRVAAAALEARLESLSQSWPGEAETEKSLRSAVDQGRIGRWLGMLSDHLTIDPGFESAVLAALGDLADGWALGDSDDIASALELMPGGVDEVEAALVPARPLRQPPAPARADAPGCLGSAADHVRVPAELKPLVDLLLGRTLVAVDRRAARDLLVHVPDDVRVVTQAGELFDPSGSVRVGVRRRNPAIRERRRQRLEADLRAAQAAVREAEAGRSAALEAVQEALAARDRARATAELSERERHQAGSHLEQAAWAAREAEQHRADATRRLEASQQERQHAESELAAARAEADTRAAERARGDADLRAVSEAVREAAEGGAAYRLRQAETRVLAARQAAEDAAARMLEIDERLGGIEAEIAARRQRLQDLKGQEDTLATEIGQSKTELETIDAALTAVSERALPLEASLSDAEAERSRLETVERQARMDLQVDERRHAQAQIDLARRQEELNSLKRRIEDDFGLVAFDYDENTIVQTPLPLEGLVEKLPVVEVLSPEIESQVNRLRIQLRRMGAINPEAQREYEEVRERVEFMTTQVQDLREAERKLQDVIAELDALMEREFRKTFEAVAVAFREAFTRLFGGGVARLHLTDPDDMTSTGIDIEARLPGRREQGLAMLSGGERSLTACALVFALLRVSPTPVCVLDEVDAMLDEANVGRFREMLQELSNDTQFIIITHNRETVQAAQVVYGVSMGGDTASRIISLKLDEAAEQIRAR